MKFNFDIECSPEEARRFLGLPDVTPLHDSMMREMEKHMKDNIAKLDPNELAKSWFANPLQHWQEMQKTFWAQMAAQQPPKAKPPKDKDAKDGE